MILRLTDHALGYLTSLILHLIFEFMIHLSSNKVKRNRITL